jgi:hypothetical protein
MSPFLHAAYFYSLNVRYLRDYLQDVHQAAYRSNADATSFLASAKSADAIGDLDLYKAT